MGLNSRNFFVKYFKNKNRAAPLVIAHRGASWDLPENTLASFEAGTKNQADAMETDIQYSLDRVPVLHHDKTLVKSGFSDRHIFDQTWEQLSRLDAGKWKGMPGQGLVRADHYIKIFGPRIPLCLELKNREGQEGSGRLKSMAREVYGMVRGYNLLNRVVFFSFDRHLLKAVRRMDAGVPLLYLRDSLPEGIPRRIKQMSQLFGVGVNIYNLNKSFVEEFHRMGLRVFTYTCDQPAMVEKALRFGVDAIITDRPRWVRTNTCPEHGNENRLAAK